MSDYYSEQNKHQRLVGLKKARKEGNQWALMVDSQHEKPYTDLLIKLNEERDRIAFNILCEVGKHAKRLYEITHEIDVIEKEMYDKISGEWGMSHLYDEIMQQFENFDTLYNLTDGVIYGYNIDKDDEKEMLDYYKELLKSEIESQK